MQWHLKYSGHKRLDFLLNPRDVPVAQELLFIEPGWSLAEQPDGRNVKISFQRK